MLAVGADQDRHGQDRLRLLAVGGLDVAAEEQVELLVGPPQLDVGLDRDRVVALQQRVEQLERGDRRAGGEPLLEVVALDQAGDRGLRQQAEQLLRRHPQPLAVEADLGALAVEQLEGLLLVGGGVGLDLLGRGHRPLRRAAAGVADPGGEVADDQHDLVARLLELAQLLQDDRVAEVDVGRGRVDPELDPQRPPGRELLLQHRRRQHVDRVARQVRHGPNARLPPPLGGPGRRVRPSMAIGTKAPPTGRRSPPPPRRLPRSTQAALKKLRILFVLLGLAVLGLVSMVFGMMAAVSQDLPAIYNFAQYKASKNSEVFDASGEPIGTLTSDQNKILLTSGQISPNIKNAVVSIEDSRFYEHNGVDFQGIARALIKDVLSQSAAAGRLDDHRAVRQERARSRRQPHGLREVPRGGARLPARAPLDQGQNPHRVPQHDLLRRGRLRDRGRRPHLLRQRPPGLRHANRALRLGARALGGGDAGRRSSPRLPPTTPRSTPKTP